MQRPQSRFETNEMKVYDGYLCRTLTIYSALVLLSIGTIAFQASMKTTHHAHPLKTSVIAKLAP